MDITPARPDDGDHAAKYNVKAVSHLVGVSPVTLRAWERRYGLPTPQRGSQGYRLYSEYDIRTLRWLKAQIEAGMSISRAAQHLSDLRSAGNDPALTLRRQAAAEAPVSCANLSARAMEAWIEFNDAVAAETLRLAFSLYPIDRVLLDVVRPALVELGERWHRGQLPVAVEHFATQFCLRYLQSMAAAAGVPSRSGLILAACAPGEQHEIGLLMLAVMLRWRGWDVTYLGQNLKLERLDEALAPLRPRLMLFSATRPEAAEALLALPPILARFPAPAPRVVVGGPAFAAGGPALPAGWACLDAEPNRMVRAIEDLLTAAS
ncbi:MAG: MerR family transcriptional regulator [Anaerolineales bacterium]|nr:MerR family transcriptional regulator [Anaerolineales bacterium]